MIFHTGDKLYKGSQCDKAFQTEKTSLKPSEDVYKKADDVQLNKSVKKIGFYSFPIMFYYQKNNDQTRREPF